MATINLASEYSKEIQEKFFTESVLMGKTDQSHKFAGVRTVIINTPITQPLVDYNRTASANRFGTPEEMKDYIQELTLSQDKSYAITIDKGNLSDQQYIKEAGKMVKLQIREQVVPHIDKYGLQQFALNGGLVFGGALPTKATIVSLVADGLVALDNAEVPDDGNRHIYIGASQWNNLRLSPEYLAIDALGQKSLEKGVIGMFMNAKVTKVPNSWLPNIHFLITHKASVTLIQKLQTLKLNTDPQGIDGALIEGRHYFDAFVYGTKAAGVYSHVLSANVQAVVTITNSAAVHTLTSAGATKVMYTIDGTDPRYSPTAVQVSSGATVTLTDGQTVKAVAYKTDIFPSAVSEKKYTA